jgi:superfamily II DNA helicase RecQ
MGDKFLLDIKLLYLTPERIVNALEDTRDNRLKSMLKSLFKRQKLARFVVDEAHCVPQWGHEFRYITFLILKWVWYIFFLFSNSSHYLKLCILKSLFPTVSIVALTATATPQTRLEIKNLLNLHNPCEIFISIFLVNTTVVLFSKLISSTAKIMVVCLWY